MGAPELAVAWEQERANGVWAMMAGVLAMQGVADIDADTLRAFHAVVPEAVVIEPVVYGTGSGRDLSGLLARPADATTTGDRPAVVLVHGGGWMSGHAAMHLRHAAFLAAQGYVALTINYRLAQEAEWPACRDDVVSALRWLRGRDDLGVDPARVGLTGGSAGGHLAAMVAATGGDDAPAAVVLWYPVADLKMTTVPEPIRSALGGVVDGMVGPTDAEKDAASPAAHVTAAHPPVLTLVGDADHITPADAAADLHRRYDEVGVVNELVVLPGLVHGFEAHPDEWGWSYERMQAFFDANLGRLMVGRGR